MKKETAIDWLIACLPPQKENEDYMKAIITQAKKMEKEQIIDAYWGGRESYGVIEERGEAYYIDNYKL